MGDAYLKKKQKRLVKINKELTRQEVMKVRIKCYDIWIDDKNVRREYHNDYDVYLSHSEKIALGAKNGTL